MRGESAGFAALGNEIMNLSAETFERIVASVRTDQSVRDERRSSTRVGVRAIVTIYLIRDNDNGLDAAQVTVRDISAGGIGLMYNSMLRVGRRFLIRLPRVDDQPLPLVCVVRQCRAVSPGVHIIGAEFLKPAPAVEKTKVDVAPSVQEQDRIRDAILN